MQTVVELGWSTFSNGELLVAAEGDFDVLITTDRNVRHQQRVTGRGLAIIVLPTTSWPRIQLNSDAISCVLVTTVLEDMACLAFDEDFRSLGLTVIV